MPRNLSGGGVPCRELAPFTAMTTEVRCLIPADAPGHGHRRAIRRVFAGVERHLTRFREESELNRLCIAGGGAASPALFRGLTTAARAWHRTGGLFDPRVRAALEALGYTGGLVFGGARPEVAAPRGQSSARAPVGERRWMTVRWTRERYGMTGPKRTVAHRLALPERPRLDLGGIGKGLAVRYAARTMRARLRPGRRGRPKTFGLCGLGGTQSFLIDAGGDIWAEGLGPAGSGWQIGIPGPRGDAAPICLLRVANRAVCTSGRGRRTWLVDGRPVHHLIDPRTGQPAGTRLWSVTVIGRDPAWAEVWSKSVFVAGAGRGEALAAERGLAAVFVYDDGRVAVSPAGGRHLDPAMKGEGMGC